VNNQINISEFFNNYRQIVSTQRWILENKKLTNFQIKKLSIPFTTIGMEYFGDMSSRLISVVENEINQDINRTLVKSLFNTGKFDYLDLRPNFSLMNDRNHLEKLVGMILSNDYQNLVTTSLIASQLQDSSSFSACMTTSDDFMTPECFGRLGGRIDVYADPYMKFNDGRLCLFNGVQINIEDMKAVEVVNPISMQTNILIEWKFAHYVGDSKLIFVIEDETSEATNQYKALQRDIKIDNILDGK
jgi:hypothetical protein